MLLGKSSFKKPQKKLAALLSNNFGGNTAQSLLSSSPFYAQLTKSLVLNRGTGSPSYTRATTAVVKDHEGVLRTVPSGCARFEGARFVRNLLPSSEDLTSGWTATGSTPAAGSITENGLSSGHYAQTTSMVVPSSAVFIMQAEIKQSVGTRNIGIGTNSVGNAIFNPSTGVFVASDGVTLDHGTGDQTADGYWPVWVKVQSTTSNKPIISLYSGTTQSYAGDGASQVLVRKFMVEDITGRTDQTTPSEYVSVGVLSAPYHGSGVDGVKYFDTDLSGNPLPTNYTYDAVSLNGVAGTYVSTPDSVANSITGDIEFVGRVNMTDWIPATQQRIESKWNWSANKRSWSFSVLGDDAGANAGKFAIETSADGTAVVQNLSSVANTLTNATTYWIRMTLDVNDGSGNRVANFYYASDQATQPTSWTQLGTTVTTAGVTTLHDNDSVAELGSITSGTLQNLSGKIYRAQIYNGINGTLAVDFDASRYAGGTTLTGSTGETWTLNGNAVIHPTNYPLLGYEAEGARTNLCLQSNVPNTASWVAVNTPQVTTAVAISPDGSLNAWSLTDNTAIDFEYIQQTIGALTAASYTASIFIKKTTGAQTGYPILQAYRASGNVFATVDTTNGVATVSLTGDGAGTAMCVSFNADYWRVSLTFTATTASHILVLYPAGALTSTGGQNVAGVGTHIFYGEQLELGSLASSYIPTTTIAVARNADVDSNPTASNIAAAASTVYLEFTPDHTPNGTIALWGTYVDASNYTAILHDATNLIMRKRIAGVNYDATIANAFTANTTYKVCGSWGAAGVTITLNGTEGTPHANTTAAQIAATMQWGADGNSLQQPFAKERNARAWQRQLSASERAAITQ